MKKKLAALLCILALVIPALCASEMTDTGYTCDACKYAGSFCMVVTGTETRDGIPGEWISVQCPQCGAHYTSYWRATGGAEVPAEPEPPAEEPAYIPPAVKTDPPAPQPAETMPPVAPKPKSNPAPGKEPSGQQPPQELQASPPEEIRTAPPAVKPSGNPSGGTRRNIRKYPYFSAAYPSRRLKGEGDQDALAPVPGIPVYPEPAAEGSSILRHMLDGN